MIPTSLAEELRQREAALDHFLTEWAESLRKFESAEKRYSAVVDEYRASEPNAAVADIKASNDARLRQAMGDCAYYRDRAVLYATSAQLELARGGLS